MKKAIALIRVSTEGQAGDDRAGIAGQKAAIQRIAQQYVLDVVRTVEMTDVSGTAVLRAPEMQELLKLIESPDIHGVVAREFSRLMRPERFEDFILLQAFQDTKTILYLPEGPLDLTTKAGSFIGGIRALMAGWERREILDRMNGAKETMRLAGKHAAGAHCLPFGVVYDRSTGIWSYTPEAEKLKEAFRLVLTTSMPFAQIAERLNLSRTNLRYMLMNPIYAGIRQYTQKRDPSAAGYIHGENGRQGYRRKILRAPDEVIRIRVMDGLVSEAQFARVQEIIGARVARERTTRERNGPRYIFNGFLACGKCGERMYSRANTKAEYYLCSQNDIRKRRRGGSCDAPYILAKKIEPKIEHVLCDTLKDRAMLEDVARSYSSRQMAEIPRSNQDAAQLQIKTLSAKRDRIMESFFDGVISKAERDVRIAGVEAEIATYAGMMATKPEAQAGFTAAQLADLLSVFSEFRFLPRDDKRRIMAAAQARVFVDGYTIKSVEVAMVRSDQMHEESRNADRHPKMGRFQSPVHPCR